MTIPEVVIFLLDVSNSMLSPANQLDTKCSCAKAGIEYFFRRCHWQTVACIAFASHCNILLEFTKYQDLLPYAFDKWEIKPGDSDRNLENAFNFAERHVIEKFGLNQACQVIMITDERSPQGHRSFKFKNPLWRTHIICMANEVNKDEDSKETNRMLQEYRNLLNRRLPFKITKNHPKGNMAFENEGAFCFISYPQTKDKIINTMDSIAEKYFLPYKSTLLCGQIFLPVVIYPTIHTIDGEDVQELVKVISIVEFVSKNSFRGEPSRYRFWIFLDDDRNDIKENYNEYFHVLWLSLRNENRIAVAWLQDNTFATIEVSTTPENRTNQTDMSVASGSYFYFTVYSRNISSDLLSSPTVKS
ncbi:13933_t:CDS:2, partial [Acaulospora morrowiae]